MSSSFTRRQVLTSAAAGSAVLASQVILAGPASAASAATTATAAAAPASVSAGTVAAASAAAAAVRVAPFPVGYSTGSTILFDTAANIVKTLDAIVASGGTTIRFDIMWVLAQPTQTTFSWDFIDSVVVQAHARNLTILGIITTCPQWAALNGGNAGGTGRPRSAAEFGTFAGLVATRYKGWISSYEIWNEPNSREFFAPDPDPTFYGQMVKAAYPKIKAADPTATVVAGALGPAADGVGTVNPITFVTKMYAAGAAGFFDAFSFHPYDYTQTLSAATLWDNTAARRMIQIHALMKQNGDGLKKIWITEYGAPTAAVTQAKQASLIGTFMQSWGEVSYAGPVYIYTLRDINGDSGGVTTATFAKKQAYTTIKNLQASGLPLTTVGAAFKANADSALGATVSVSYPMGTGVVQECENGSRYQTKTGWFSSPTAVATLARVYQFVPKTAFANGYQDFDRAGGFRIFYSAATGAHSVAGIILAKWDSTLGLAKTDEYTSAADGSRSNDFVRGRITWSATTGIVTVTRT